jgi:hypothetical protein
MTTLAPICALLIASAGAFDPPAAPTPEIEPNQTRETATPFTPSADNLSSFTGVCRGFVADPLSTATDTRDMWAVTLNANPALIQRHRLQLSTPGTQGHTASVIGVQANSGVIDPASMVALQNSSINTVPARYCQVYSLGSAAPSFLYRITGSSGTTLSYTVTVTTDTVTPTAIRSCPFLAGSITITTVGLTTLNTKLFLYDADTLAAVPDGLNDDTPSSAGSSTGSPQSTLTRTLAPGRYLLAVSNGDTYDNRLPPADDRAATQPIVYLTESAGLLVNSSSTATGNFSFSIADSSMSVPLAVTASKPGAFGVVFYKFETQYRCGLADMGTTGAQPCFDNALDNNDFIVFVDRFFRSVPAADIGKAGGVRGSDNRWDNNDWIIYIDEFFGGCG